MGHSEPSPSIARDRFARPHGATDRSPATGHLRSGARDVTIGIIAALPIECAAMAALIRDLEVVHVEGDPNDYRIGYLDSVDSGRPHRVVLTTMPLDNTRNAATVSTDLIRTFAGVRCIVMTGIAGGIPSRSRPERHVRLGDVVVAIEGIVDYGHIRTVDGTKHLRRFVDGMSIELLRAAQELRVRAYSGTTPDWSTWLAPVRRNPMAVFARPAASTDELHVAGQKVAHPEAAESGHLDGTPKVHHGAVGCADELLRDEQRRDDLAREYGILAVEMEGSGIASGARLHGVAWFMVRGVADYCENTGKSDRWHAYASMTAAAYVRALLGVCRPFPVWRAEPRGGALALLPDHDRDRVAELFRRLPDLDLHTLWRASTGEHIPLPASRPESVGDLFDHLLALNAGPDGVPPALALIEAIAVRVDESLAAALRDWVDQTAQRLDIVDVIRAHRRARRGPPRPEPKPARPCLVIQIIPDNIDGTYCTISYWIQSRAGPWRPEPGDETRHTLLEGAQRVVAKAVRHAETAWRESREPVAVEFLLPTELLHLEVEWWRTELTSKAPPPLCLDYPVAVRSLDRMRADHRRRVWTSRWEALWADPPSHRLYWGNLATPGADPGSWDAGLRENSTATTVVLSAPPHTEPGRVELDFSLRAGVPVIAWDRRSPRSAATIALIQDLTAGGPEEFVERLHRLRVEAAVIAGDERDSHPGRHVALLWDDPYRIIDMRRPEP